MLSGDYDHCALVTIRKVRRKPWFRVGP
jgi:hypothetical protein